MGTMSPHDRPTTGDHTNGDATTTVRRRRFLALGLGAGATMLAGCSGNGATESPAGGNDDGPTDGESGDTEGTASEQSGTFRLLISDRPNAIDDFDSLEVSFDRARVFRSGDGEDATETAVPTEATATPTPTETIETTTTADGAATTPTATGEATEEEDDEEGDGDGEEAETTEEPGDDEAGGFTTIDLDGATVDLTEVVGAKATGIFEGGLAAGRYTKIELHAAKVRGVVDGEPADVKLPSGKLMLTKPFTVEAASSVSFVFDISVVKKGNGGYNLLPVVSESGVAGKDVDVEEVGGDGDGGTDDGGTEGGEPDSTSAENDPGGGEGGGHGGGNGDTPTPEETATTE